MTRVAGAMAIAFFMTMCPARIDEVTPSKTIVSNEFLTKPAIATLIHAEIEPGIPPDALRSPDGSLVLTLTADRAWFNHETDFYGVTMEEVETKKRFPVFSFWGNGVDSGITLGLKWSEGSDAIRFTGLTRGFERRDEQNQTHDVDLLLDTKSGMLYDLHAQTPTSENHASPSKYALPPPPSAVTARARGVRRRGGSQAVTGEGIPR